MAIASPQPINIENVTKSFRSARGSTVEALGGLTLHVAAGEFVSLLGPSGCGKSTLLMMVAGLLSPTTGSITIGNRVVDRAQTDIGIAFQSALLLDWRTAMDNVLLQVEIRHLDKKKYRQVAGDLFRSVGLSGFEDHHPFELSGGMQQRVAMCRALIHDPPLLVMDEPFSAIDALTRDQLSLDLQRLWERQKQTVVFVTHSIPEAVFLSDRVVVMSPRPGTVEDILTIDLPRPRALEVRESEQFVQYARRIRNIFEARGVLSRA